MTSRLDHLGASYAVVDVSTNSTTVLNAPGILYGVTVNTTLSAHACPIQDNTSPIITLAASAAAGTTIALQGGIRFSTSLVVDPNDAATGSITVWYRPA